MMYRNKRYQNKWLTGFFFCFSKLIMVFTLNMLNNYLSVMPHLVFLHIIDGLYNRDVIVLDYEVN